jgi:predicted DNA repair protein MutK
MRFLSVAGTAAMFLVGGGILVHGIGPLHHWTEELGHGTGIVAALAPTLANGFVGVVAGGLVLGLVTMVTRLRGGAKAAGRPH